MPYEITVTVTEDEDARRLKHRAQEEAQRRRQPIQVRAPQPVQEEQRRDIWYHEANSTEVKRAVAYDQAGPYRVVQAGTGTIMAGSPAAWQDSDDPDVWRAYQFAMWWAGLTPAERARHQRFVAAGR